MNNFWIMIGIPILSIFIAQNTLSQSIKIDGSTPTTAENCTGNCTISGGVQRGQNLFHSFLKFNIDLGQTVLFSDPGVTNILSRVTGNNQSNILGTLGTVGGKANLFLLNPNGILFGPNSSLSVNGSFVATTANAIQFNDQGVFSASTPEIPLLNVSPSAFLFTMKPEGITTQSRQSVGRDPFGIEIAGLQVPTGKSLLFVGGDLTIDGETSINENNEIISGGLHAFGGRIALSGLAEPGSVEVSVDGDNLNLNLSDDMRRADISIINGATLNVEGDMGGNIDIRGDDILISNKSSLQTGIAFERGFLNSQSEDIDINASSNFTLSDSRILSRVIGTGSSGNININAYNIDIKDGSIIENSTFGRGNAGNVTIEAVNEISLDKISEITSATQSFGEENTEFFAIGNGGDVNVIANKISLANLSRITTFGNGLGQVGDVNITAIENISLVLDSRIGSSVGAKDINTISKNADPEVRSAIRDPAVLNLINTPSKVAVSAKSLSLTDGSQIANFATRTGVGAGGDIEINTEDSVFISGSSRGTNFLEQVPFSDDLDPSGMPKFILNGTGFSSGLFTFARDSTTGPAGSILVKTQDFQVSNGGAVSTQTFNESQGGDVTVIANNFTVSSGGQIRTSASSTGNGGDINLKIEKNINISGNDPNFENRLTSLQQGLTLFERVSPEEAKEEIMVLREIGFDSGVFANTTRGSTGSGGDITIDPQLVLIEDGARIAVNSEGTGPGGSIDLQADNLTLDRSTISATSTSGQGGDISLDIDNLLLLQNNSEISASAGNENTNGDGGDVTIDADLIVTLQNSNIIANAFTGRGGNVTINTRGLFLSSDRDISASSELGIDGIVEINTPEVDPSESLSELPETVAPLQDVAKGCRPGQTASNSSFVHVGRGGLPSGPYEAQTPPSVWQDLRAHNLPTPTPSTNTSSSSPVLTPPPGIVEAKGWTKDSQGRLYLTANAPQASPTPWSPTAAC